MPGRDGILKDTMISKRYIRPTIISSAITTIATSINNIFTARSRDNIDL